MPITVVNSFRSLDSFQVPGHSSSNGTMMRESLLFCAKVTKNWVPPPSAAWDIFQLITSTHGCPGHTQPTAVSYVCHSGLICLSAYTACHKPLQKIKGKLCLLSYRGVISPWPRQGSRVDKGMQPLQKCY